MDPVSALRLETHQVDCREQIVLRSHEEVIADVFIWFRSDETKVDQNMPKLLFHYLKKLLKLTLKVYLN